MIDCRRGITAMEVLITVAILLVVAGLAAPWILTTLQAYRLRAAAWELAGDLRLARQKAVSLQQRHRICFSGCSAAVPAGGYLLEREQATGVWVMETSRGDLPDGITITTTSGGTITFEAKGEVNPATITLISDAGTYQLTTAQTGRVQVCKGECS